MRMLITATPPTPNGDLHLGHLSGPYLAADTLRRFHTVRGTHAVYLTGIDDHQSYTDVRARQDARPPESVADDFGDRIEQVWRSAGMAPDVSGRPRRDPLHAQLVQDFVARLHHKGHLVPKTAPAPFCSPCDRVIFEGYVRGGCPHCGRTTGGNACEDCGEPNDCGELASPVCVLCGEPAEIKPVERLYFRLSAFEQPLRHFWDAVRMPPHLRELCLRMAAKGLPDVAVSHPSDWGLPVPIPGFETHRVYVWFEMGPGYLAAAESLPVVGGARAAGWRAWWGDPQVPIVQCFGFDNGWFHAVLFPAMFMAYDEDIVLPSSFVTNEFYRLGDDKFSTSRRHAIWARDFFEEESVDVTRVLLARERPEATRTSFTMEHYRREEAHITEVWGGWVQAVGRRVLARTSGLVPAIGELRPEHRAFSKRLEFLRDLTELAYDEAAFSPQLAVETVDLLVRVATVFGDHHDHLANMTSPGGDVLATATALELQAVALFALLLYPISPGISLRVRECLGQGAPELGDWAGALRPLPQGLEISALSKVELV